MTRSELIRRIAQAFPMLPPQDVAAAVGHLLEQMGEALAKGERVDIRGFGCFVLRRRRTPTIAKPAATSPGRAPAPRFDNSPRQRAG